MSNPNPDSNPIVTTAALARHLGLSRWTVSRVLNGHQGVKQDTVDRIHQAMEKLHFAPNPIARGLRGARTGMIGVCFLELETPMLVRKTVVLQQILREQGYQAIIELTGGRLELEEQVIASFQALKVDGIFLVGSSLNPDSPAVSRLEASGIPVVAVDPHGPLPFPKVAVNRLKAYQMLVEHLLDLDPSSSIGVIGLHEGVIYGGERLKGLSKAAQLRGRDEKELFSHYYDAERQDLFYEHGYDLCGRVLEAKGKPPRALLCLNDQLAIGAIRKLTEKGISIPEDVRVTGFDNLHISEFTYPSLTTIGQRVADLMKTATEVLLDWVMTGEPPKKRSHILTPRLIVRESTAGFKARADAT